MTTGGALAPGYLDPANLSPPAMPFLAEIWELLDGVYHRRGAWPEFLRRFTRDPDQPKNRRAVRPGEWQWRRLERLRGIVIVAKVLIWHMQLRTLRCRKKDARGDFVIGLTEDDICKASGLSRDQVARALADLRAAGFLLSDQHREHYGTGPKDWEAYPAVRTFTERLFRKLGRWWKLKQLRKQAGKKGKQGPPPPRELGDRPPEVRHAIEDALGGAASPAPVRRHYADENAPPWRYGLTPDQTQAVTRMASEILRERPGGTMAAALDEARRRWNERRPG